MANVNGIDLEEFIEETMHKVMNGVRKVTEKVGLQDENGNFIAGINIGRKDTSVDFDVALTVSQDAKGGGRSQDCRSRIRRYCDDRNTVRPSHKILCPSNLR